MTTRDKMPDPDRDTAFLDALFDDMRAETPTPDPSPDLLARVLSDAEAVQAGFKTEAFPVVTAPSRGILQQIGAALGGWPAFAGLAAASLCGVWLGISPPQGISDTASLYFLGEEALLDPVSGFDFEMGEG